ncbi:hypothetical protein ACHQM5_024818 [Ranunculus cassubicifolius]
MSKLTTMFMITLLLFSTLLYVAARPNPKASPSDIHYGVGETGEKKMEMDESCEGVGEDECLMRRTLAAHTDYIYTQKHTNP